MYESTLREESVCGRKFCGFSFFTWILYKEARHLAYANLQFK